MKKQIVIIHGGDSFKTYKEYFSFLKRSLIDLKRYASGKRGWKENISKTLGSKFEVIMPRMPNPTNAKYVEWKIWFEKLVPFLKNGVVLIGHSLGGLFLAKYLSEKKFPKKINTIFLIAAPYSGGDFTAPKNLKKLALYREKVFLYHSKDDRIVPFSDFQKYQKGLKNANVRIFKNRGHFTQEKFPELIKAIKSLF